MPKRTIRLDGPGVRGTQVNASLLRDLLGVVIDGSQGAVRLRTQGRSTARGMRPAWISAASEYLVEIKEGSTLLEIDAPTLYSVDPVNFSQRSLFPDIDPDLTSFDYFAASLAAAIRADQESPLVDQPMIGILTGLRSVFKAGVDYIEFNGTRAVGPGAVRIREEDISEIADLGADIPPPQHVRIAAKLDIIRHSDGAFYLALPAGEKVQGIARLDQLGTLQGLWGSHVLVAGTAYFSPAGRLLRIEAQAIRPSTEKDAELWQVIPEPLGIEIPEPARRISQGPRSGLNAIFGKWPGDEDDDTIVRALEGIS